MQDPVGYENNKSAAQESVDILVPKLISTLRWNTCEQVLDYGCGAGSTGFKCILPKVEQMQSKMYSVDVSAKMLAFAEEHYPHELISYGVGDILDEFPFKNVKFDKIIGVNVLHFIRDIRQALSGFHGILKPAGQLGFTMYPAKTVVFQFFRKLANSPTWKQYMSDYLHFYPIWSEFPEGQERSVIEDLMKSSGFRVIELEIFQRTYHFESMDTLLDVALSVNPCLNNIPTELVVAFKDELREMFTQSNGVPLDSQTFDFHHQLIWGVIEKLDEKSE